MCCSDDVEPERLNPVQYQEQCRLLFATLTEQELLERIERENRNNGWGVARSIYLAELRDACESRGMDYEALRRRK